jgi:hypothetical protein
MKCCSCWSKRIWLIQTAREQPHGTPIRVVAGKNPMGTFSTRVCDECGYTEWFEQQPSTLEARDGVTLIAPTVAAPPSSQGPYR